METSKAVTKRISEKQATDMLLTNSFPIEEAYIPLMSNIQEQLSVGLVYARVLVLMENGKITYSPINYHILNATKLKQMTHRPFTQEGSNVVAKKHKAAGVTNKVQVLNTAIPAGLEYYPLQEEDDTLDLSGTYQYRSTVKTKKGSNDETKVSIRFENSSLNEKTVTKALNNKFGFGCNGLYEVMVVGLATNTMAYQVKDESPKIFFNVNSFSLYAREVRENSSDPEKVMKQTPGGRYGKDLGDHLSNIIAEAQSKKLKHQNIIDKMSSSTGEDLAKKAAIGAVIEDKDDDDVIELSSRKRN